jgi:hypothetical protein
MVFSSCLSFFLSLSLLQCWGLNPDPHTCEESVLPVSKSPATVSPIFNSIKHFTQLKGWKKRNTCALSFNLMIRKALILVETFLANTSPLD